MRRAGPLALVLLAACAAPVPVVPMTPVVEAAPAPPTAPSASETPDDTFWYRAPAVVPAAPFSPPRPQELRLASGARVLLVEQHHAPLVTVAASIRWSAPPVAATETMLVQVLLDAADASGWRLRERSVAAGSARIEAEYAVLPMSTASSELGPALRALVDGLMRGAIQADRLEVLRRRALDARARSTARDRTWIALSGWLFAAGSYHDHVLGYEAGLQKLTVRGLEGYREAALVPESITWSVVGDVEPAALREALERATAGWKPPRPGPPAVRPLKPTSGSLLEQIPQASRAYVVVLAPAPGAVGPDPGADIAENMLLQPLSERMRARFKQLTGEDVGVTTGLSDRGGQYFLEAESEVRGPSVPALARAFLDAMGELARGEIADEELDRERKRLLRWQDGLFEGARSTATTLALPLTRGLPADWPAERYRATLAVRREDVRRAAEAHLRKGEARVVARGDVAGVKDELERMKLGPVTVKQPPRVLPGAPEARK